MTPKLVKARSEQSVGEAATEKLNFEWFRYDHGPQRDEWGDREVVDVSYQRSATILQPEPGKVIAVSRGSILLRSCEHNHEKYAVIQHEDGCFAVRADLSRCDSTRIELRAVALEGPRPSLAWEIYTENRAGSWVPMEGQHLRERTAKPTEWLAEVEGILLLELVRSQANLVREYCQLAELPSLTFRCGRPLEPETAVSLARNAVLKCDFDNIEANASAAQVCSNTASAALERHRKIGERLGAAAYLPWVAIPRWKQSLRLRKQADKAKEISECTNERVQALKQLAENPARKQEIEHHSALLLQVDRLKREADAVTAKIIEARALVTFLRQCPDEKLTLTQSTIQGRRLVTLPQRIPLQSTGPELHIAPRQGL